MNEPVLYALHHETTKKKVPSTKKSSETGARVKLTTVERKPLSLKQALRLKHVLPDKLLAQSLAESRRAALNNDARGLERGDLAVSTALAAGDDGAGVAHAPAGRRGDAGDEGDDGLLLLLVGLAQEVGRILLGGAADLADHDDAVSLRVLEEDLQAVDEVRAAEGVAADADDERLAQAGLCRLVDGFVGQGAGAGDDADAAALVDEAGHDADLALALGGCVSGLHSERCEVRLCLVSRRYQSVSRVIKTV